MASVTLAHLRARAREAADAVGSDFVTDTADSLDAWINEGGQKLHEMLIKAYGADFLEKSATITTSGGAVTLHNLPDDFFILYGFDFPIGGVTFSLLKYQRAERNLYKNTLQGYWRQRPRYKLSGSRVQFIPAPAGGITVTCWYAPVFTLLVNPSDTCAFYNGWERYVVTYAAIRIGMKEETDVRDLRLELSKMEQELEEIAVRRDADQPCEATDLEAVENDDPLLYF